MSSNSDSESVRAELARSVLTRNLKVRRGEHVIVEAWTHTLPWAVAFAREVRRMGAFPLIPYEEESSYWDSVDEKEFGVLGNASTHEWAALAATNVYIHMWGPGDRVRLAQLGSKGLNQVFKFNDSWYTAARKAGLRGSRMEIGRPYPALAEAYGVDLGEWTDQVVRGTMVPPEALQRTAGPIERALTRGRELRIRSDDGTDLKLRLAGAAPVTAVGRPRIGDKRRPFDLLTNLPSGAIRVALDEKVADGTIVGNRSCYYEDGKATRPVFRFEGGKLTETEFSSGKERFDGAFRSGGKGRDQPGFLAIGLNPELHDTPQVEDLERGAVMVSVGGNRAWGGRNASSFFGWAINQGANVEVDGRALAL
jgi:leucyl aminopeptidase (aminopeptidase T)